MVITNEFYFRGWLPAGLVINSRLISAPLSKPYGSVPVLTPIINPCPDSSWGMHQPSPVFPISQATDTRAIVLKDPIQESTLVMLPSGDWNGPGTPYILAINTWYDGRIQTISGEDTPAVRLILSNPHLYLNSTEAEPGDPADTVVGEMPAYFLKGAHGRSELFVDATNQTSDVPGFAPRVTIEGEELPARCMQCLVVKPAHTAGTAVGLLKDPAYAESMEYSHYIRCSLDGGKVVPPEGAGQVKYYGIMPVSRKHVQPIFAVRQSQIEISWAGQPISLLSSSITAMPIGVIDTYGEDKVVHYN